jgi:hypothetical protein
MGQQQLLLLLLSIVVVGVAVIAGILLFEDHFRRGSADEIMNRNIVIAQEAVHWRARSTMQGGGDGSFDGLNPGAFEKLGFADETAYATFAISEVTESSILVEGVSLHHEDVGAWVRVTVSEVDSGIHYDGSVTLP